jgi:hypothetical protein
MMQKSTTTFVLKISVTGTDDIRRFRLEDAPTFESLKKLIDELYGPLYVIRYQDEEGDWCLLLAETFDDFLEQTIGKGSSVGRIQLTCEAKAGKTVPQSSEPLPKVPQSSEPLPVPTFSQEYQSPCGPKPFLIGLAQLAAAGGWEPQNITTLMLCHLPTIRQRIMRKAERLNHIDGSCLANLSPSLLAFADAAESFTKEGGDTVAALAREVVQGRRGLGMFLTELMQWLGRNNFAVQSGVLQRALENLLRANSNIFLHAFNEVPMPSIIPLKDLKDKMWVQLRCMLTGKNLRVMEDKVDGCGANGKWTFLVARIVDASVPESPVLTFQIPTAEHSFLWLGLRGNDPDPVLSRRNPGKDCHFQAEVTSENSVSISLKSLTLPDAHVGINKKGEAIAQHGPDGPESQFQVLAIPAANADLKFLKPKFAYDKAFADPTESSDSELSDTEADEYVLLEETEEDFQEGCKWAEKTLGGEEEESPGDNVQTHDTSAPDAKSAELHAIVSNAPDNKDAAKEAHARIKHAAKEAHANLIRVKVAARLAVQKAKEEKKQVCEQAKLTQQVQKQAVLKAREEKNQSKLKQQEEKQLMKQQKQAMKAEKQARTGRTPRTPRTPSFLQLAVKLKAVDTESLLEWPVHIRYTKQCQALLCTPQGNVKSGKHGDFSNKGGEGIWARWDQQLHDNGFCSFKHAGTSKYLAVDSSGKAVLSDTQVLFEISPAEPTTPRPPSFLQLAVKLKAVDTESLLEWPVHIRYTKECQALLCTPQGNVKCGKHGDFSNKGGEGIWARWDQVLHDKNDFCSFKHAGTSKYLAVDSSGKAVLSDTQVLFEITPAEPNDVPVQAEWLAGTSTYRLPVEEESDTVILSVTHGEEELALPWAVQIKSYAAHGTYIYRLSTPEGNIRCGPKRAFDNKGGDGHWARWTKCEETEVSNGKFSLKNVGHGKFLSLQIKDGKVIPALSETPVNFSVRNVAEVSGSNV